MSTTVDTLLYLERAFMLMQWLADITAQQTPKSYFHSLSQAERDAQLLKAVKERQAKRVQLLLDAGANPDAIGAQGKSALHLAVSSGHQQCVRMLLGAGANVHARDGAGASVWSCTRDDGEASFRI